MYSLVIGKLTSSYEGHMTCFNENVITSKPHVCKCQYKLIVRLVTMFFNINIITYRITIKLLTLHDR